jgi:hypothetical protein
MAYVVLLRSEQVFVRTVRPAANTVGIADNLSVTDTAQ